MRTSSNARPFYEHEVQRGLGRYIQVQKGHRHLSFALK